MIERVDEGKQAYLPLLLLDDEQEDMIERYLDRGALYVLRENDMILAVCVVTEEGGGIFEVKNLAVAPEHQRKGGAGLCWILCRHVIGAAAASCRSVPEKVR